MGLIIYYTMAQKTKKPMPETVQKKNRRKLTRHERLKAFDIKNRKFSKPTRIDFLADDPRD